MKIYRLLLGTACAALALPLFSGSALAQNPFEPAGRNVTFFWRQRITRVRVAGYGHWTFSCSRAAYTSRTTRNHDELSLSKWLTGICTCWIACESRICLLPCQASTQTQRISGLISQ